MDLEQTKKENEELKERLNHVQNAALIGEQSQKALCNAKTSLDKIVFLANEATTEFNACFGAQNSNTKKRILGNGLVVSEEDYLEIMFLVKNKRESDLVRYLLTSLIGDAFLAGTTKTKLLNSEKKAIVKSIIGNFYGIFPHQYSLVQSLYIMH